MTTRVIKIVVDSSGAKRGSRDVEKSLEGVDRKARSAEKSSLGVGRALTTGAIVLAATQIIQIGDAWASLQGRLKLVTDSQFELKEVTQALFDISQRTRQEIGATADLYIRLGRSTDFSNERLLNLTETIGQTIALSRAAPQQAQAALFQLGQGFAAGALRGEELNSVLEQTPELAKAIADGLEVTTGELRILGAEGELTAEKVAGALEASADRIAGEFADVPLTVGDAVTKVGNSLTQFVGIVDQATGATSGLALVLDKAAETIQGLGIIIGGASGFGARYDELTQQINDAEQAIKDLQETASGFRDTGPSNFGGFSIVPEGEQQAAREAIAEAKRGLQELIDLRNEITLNGGLTDAEREQQRVESLRNSIADTADVLNSLFLRDVARNQLADAIEDAQGKLVTLKTELDKGLIDEAEFTRLGDLIERSIAGASQRSADAFVSTFEGAREKAELQMEQLNQFVSENLISPEVADRIREKLEEALTVPPDPMIEAAEKFVDSFDTALDRARDRIEELDDFVAQNLIDAETAARIRARLEEIVEEELKVKIALDVETVQDTEQRIADLQGRIAAFNEGGFAGLRAFDAFVEARDILAEVGDEASVTVQELARLIATEEELEDILSDTTGKFAEQADALEDFFTRARENSQDILADFFAGGFESLDDFERAFAQMLQNLAAQALAAGIFDAVFGATGGAGGGGGGNGLLQGALSLFGSFFGGAADGADVNKGDFGIVGEEGPEVFQAPRAGSIVPMRPGSSGGGSDTNVSVPLTVVNTFDPAEITAAGIQADGGRSVLNIVAAKRNAFRRALGIGG